VKCTIVSELISVSEPLTGSRAVTLLSRFDHIIRDDSDGFASSTLADEITAARTVQDRSGGFLCGV